LIAQASTAPSTRRNTTTCCLVAITQALALQCATNNCSALLLFSAPAQQAFNVLRYNLNQKYDSHMDTFDPKDFGPQETQRMATVLLYLSEVEEGGETVFKKEGEDGEQAMHAAKVGLVAVVLVPPLAAREHQWC
jgi:prolyl 4-hydroxylase